MRQPEWYQRTSLDDLFAMNTEAKLWTRVVASLCILSTIWIHQAIVDVLGKQLHYIGPRENGEVVSTGLYSIVRHPIYSMALFQALFLAIAYWSWSPLVGLIVFVASFGYKILVEEQLMEENPRMGRSYLEYKKNVLYRLIPYIW